ncbi:MAG: ABC transporter ATP-binding protein [Bdellovibrionaceae bacterium]|nr:ABC transporter ATP-binding protein [Pseudobdellovibrionaceae bacterium]
MLKSTRQKYENLKFLLGPQVYGLFLLSALVGFLWFATETLFIYVFQVYLSSLGLLTPSQTWIPDWFPNGTWPAVGALLGFGFLRSLLFGVRTTLTQVSMAVFVKVQRQSLLSFCLRQQSTAKTSDIVYVFGDVVQQAGNVVGYLATALTTVCAAGLYFVYLLHLAWLEAIVGVALLGVVVIPISHVGKRLVTLSQQVASETLAVNEHLLMGLRFWTFLKTHRLIDGQIRQGESSLALVLRHQRAFALLLGINGASPLFLGILIISTISIISAEVTKTDSMVLVGFFYIFLRLAQSGSEANSIYGHIRMNWVGITTLFHWRKLAQDMTVQQNSLQIDVSPKERAEHANRLKSKGVDIKFSNVEFGWTPYHSIINNLSFEIGRGDVFLLRGPSGSGKSSLLSIILGLQEPRQGLVQINGMKPSLFFDLFADDIAYVGPEPVLIPGTIRENLVFGLSPRKPIPGKPELQAVLRDVGLDQLLTQGMDLDTVLSERTELSTGQKQRLALSRVLLREPRLLVLDEVSANLDPENNKRVVEIIRRISKDMTVLVVSHRDGFEAIATKTLELSAREEHSIQ